MNFILILTKCELILFLGHRVQHEAYYDSLVPKKVSFFFRRLPCRPLTVPRVSNLVLRIVLFCGHLPTNRTAIPKFDYVRVGGGMLSRLGCQWINVTRPPAIESNHALGQLMPNKANNYSRIPLKVVSFLCRRFSGLTSPMMAANVVLLEAYFYERMSLPEVTIPDLAGDLECLNDSNNLSKENAREGAYPSRYASTVLQKLRKCVVT